MSPIKLALVTVLFAWLRALVLPVALLLRRGEYTWHNALGEDQAWNALLAGWPDETVSARAWREQRLAWIRLIDTIFVPGHCRDSYASEHLRRQLPPEYRTTP